MLPSSGFKDFIVSMGKNGPRKDFEVIHFDIIPQCVEMKRRFIELWDGQRSTFSSIAATIGSKYKQNPMDAYHMHAMKSFEEAYDHMLAFFHSEQDLAEQWQQFKSFSHKYIEADMLTDPYDAVKLITKSDIYICLSDIAGWRNNIMSYGYKNLRMDLARCIKNLQSKGINGFVDYKDPGTDLQLWQPFNVALTHLNTDLQ
jgi:hypothetical protein